VVLDELSHDFISVVSLLVLSLLPSDSSSLKSQLLPKNVQVRELKSRLKAVLVKKRKLKSCEQEGQVRVSGPADERNEA
jgi:hypothetical protein